MSAGFISVPSWNKNNILYLFFRDLAVCACVDDSTDHGVEQIYSHSFENQLPSGLVCPGHFECVVHHIPDGIWLLHPSGYYYFQLLRNIQVWIDFKAYFGSSNCFDFFFNFAFTTYKTNTATLH